MAVTTTSEPRRSLWRSRWAAVGAAIAVTLGSGGLFVAIAAPSEPSSVVTIEPDRILDTRAATNVGLVGPFESGVSRKLQVTGAVVPVGATGVLLNVTAVNPSADGFVSVRPGDAAGAPTTSSVNFLAGDIVANSVQVRMPAAGPNAGQIDIVYGAGGIAGTTDVLVDVVGYLVEGTAGPAGADGATGATGPKGPAGPEGPAGSDGSDGGSPIIGGGVDFIDRLDATGYVSLGRTGIVAASAADVGAVIPVDGTLQNLNVHLVHASGTVDVTVYVNEVATSMTCTVAATSSTCADTVNTAALTASDTIAVLIENNDGVAITNFSWTGWVAP